MERYIQVTTTTERREDAERIAQTLLERRLAACAQISGPISSSYRWRDGIESASEWLCAIKTRDALYAQVEAAIVALHPYETPEIVAVALAAGSAPYLTWIEESTTPARG
ncbi:MAG: divalent-cation tolerance protein CutA [bacterium]|nr:divalent-cation tolerance protein CutA [bacterium]